VPSHQGRIVWQEAYPKVYEKVIIGAKSHTNIKRDDEYIEDVEICGGNSDQQFSAGRTWIILSRRSRQHEGKSVFSLSMRASKSCFVANAQVP